MTMKRKPYTEPQIAFAVAHGGGHCVSGERDSGIVVALVAVIFGGFAAQGCVTQGAMLFIVGA